MAGISGVSQTSSQQGVSGSKGTAKSGANGSEFGAFLSSILKGDSANKVNEEDLFSAVVQERVKKLKGDEGLKKFQEALTEATNASRKPNGYVPIEDTTKVALIKCRESGLLTAEETDTIYSQSFAAAQLDDNKEALFDSIGGGDDPSVAVALLEQALLGARVVMDGFDSGSGAAPSRSVDEASAGKFSGSSQPSSSTGSAGFLYKPNSDSDGKLVVLLPSKLSGLIEGVKIYDPAGDLLESGRYSGNGNGGRDHYRFSKPGGDYPDGLTVEVTLSTKEKLKYVISESSQRDEDTKSSNGSTGTSGGPSGGTGGGSKSPDNSPNSL